MSLLYDASLIITPNAYKESKLYALKPQSGAGDMTITRATTATRVNSQGLIEETPYNLLTYSEQFENAAWPKAEVIVTTNAITAPDNTLTADKLIASATNSNHLLNRANVIPVIFGTSYTYTMYAKAGEYSFFRLQIQQTNFAESWANFNLLTGIVGLNAGVIADIQPKGNGWYRCSITSTATGTGNSGIQPFVLDSNRSGTSPSYLGNGTSGIYIWGAQLVQGSTPKDYFPTTDRLNVPRIDYSNGGCPSILVEPQRTNLFTYSNDFTNANWGKRAEITLTPNFGISPDGTQNSTKTTFISNDGYIWQGFILTSLTKYTISVYAKGTGGIILNAFDGINSFVSPNFTLTSNWQRFSFTFTSSSATTLVGDVGIKSANNAQIYGAQFEAGAYPTSYIPTVASTVTRNADVISKTGISSLIGQTEGTLFLDFKFIDCVDFERFCWTSSIIGNTKFSIGMSALKALQFVIFDNNNLLLNANFIATLNSRYKCILVYTSSYFKCFVNGILMGTYPTTTIPLTDKITSYDSGFGFTQPINNLMNFKTALTDTECISLTTL